MEQSTFPFPVQPLPWTTDSFPGFLSPQSLDAHYELYRHAIAKMNQFVQEHPELQQMSLQQLSLALIADGRLEEIVRAAAQAINHEFFWNILSPTGAGGSPSGRLRRLIVDEFGSFHEFIQKFNARALSQSNPEWVWLVYDPNTKSLLIDDGDDYYNPGVLGYIPLLALDLCEHSYYPDYGREKQKYINKFWRYVNWLYVEHVFLTGQT